jgi:diadenylate cyclase
VEHEPATTAGAPAELIGANPEREWETLQQSLADLGESVARYRDCGEVGKALDRVWNAAAALDHLGRTLESAHLACCILPALPERTELWRALARLSARRVGGLIVVEGEQSLDEYIARGTPLDAQLSASLLESLFHPGSALHDGAVIVRGTRVMAAGVFLPVMAERRDPVRARLIGGRHRAALGLSRLTDALVFVVSEETREISLAVRGQLHAGLHLDTSEPRRNSGSGGAPRIASMLDRFHSALRSLSGRGSPRRGARWRRRSEPSTDLG